MQKPSNLLPEGFHDALPPHAEAASRLERDVLDTLLSHGYARVSSPPLAEYEDSLTARMQGGDEKRSDALCRSDFAAHARFET